MSYFSLYGSLRDAARGTRGGNALVAVNGVQKRGGKRHVHERDQHTHRIRKQLKQRLFELACASGYGSDYGTFESWLAYREKLQAVKREDVDSQVSTTSSILDSKSAASLNRSVLERTLDSPKLSPPALPSFAALHSFSRTHSSSISKRLHPPTIKPPPLPTCLPPEAKAEVEQLWRKKDVVSKVGKGQVTERDLGFLRPGQWLNDEIVNFYGALITGRAESRGGQENQNGITPSLGPGRGELLNVHWFSTFFWQKLRSGYENGRLAEWTKKVDIFSKDVLLIPVNHSNSHWTAAAVNFRRKRIESYDSMGIRRGEVYQALRQYLDDEHRNKKKAPFDFRGWVDWEMEDTPRQENHYDCGVFTCQFLESLSRGMERFNFSQRDMAYLRERMVWEIGRGRLGD